eukprot:Skav212901  [mRNA]  locus=scaffold374:120782:136267:- [translate_table: standard]
MSQLLVEDGKFGFRRVLLQLRPVWHIFLPYALLSILKLQEKGWTAPPITKSTHPYYFRMNSGKTKVQCVGIDCPVNYDAWKQLHGRMPQASLRLGLTSKKNKKAQSVEDVMKLLQGGNQRRTTEPTAMNVTSSRSHAVFQVRVERRDREATTLGKLSLIDLAGSERASQTRNSGMRLLEGANINRSLLALGNCINALASGSAFVPFRDSKLTRLLKDSLGGNCHTAALLKAKLVKRAASQSLPEIEEEAEDQNDLQEASENWKLEIIKNLEGRASLQRSLMEVEKALVQWKAESLQAKEVIAYWEDWMDCRLAFGRTWPGGCRRNCDDHQPFWYSYLFEAIACLDI